jgi:aryl-alcohol dehydrogenase-like predicted oxidoreductase
MPLIEAGHAADLPELAIRYVISNPVLPTTEIGIATIDELQRAAAAVNRGPLPGEALARIRQIQASFVA